MLHRLSVWNVVILPAIVVMASVSEVRAQVYAVPGDFGWRKSIPLQLIMDKDVVADLGLSEETARKLQQLQQQVRQEIEIELLENLKVKSLAELTPRQSRELSDRSYQVHRGSHEILHKVRNQHREEINTLLTPEQQNRLHQIQLWKAAVPTDLLSDSALASELGLSAEQRRQIHAIHYAIQRAEIDEYKKKPQNGASYAMLWREKPAKIMNVLSNEQREAFEKLKGKPLNPVVVKDQVSTTASEPGEKASDTAPFLTFDELEHNSPPVLYRTFPVDVYRAKYGLIMGTCDLVGSPEIGKTVRLTDPVPGFGIFSGKDQPFISPHSVLIAAGGKTHDLLLTFETPVTSVSIVSDRYVETPDVIRLLIVEPIETDNARPAVEKNASRQIEVRVLAVDEKQDDSNTAPGNTLSVDLKGKPFHHVLIECTTEQEAFDDLRFTRAKDSPTDKTDRATPLFDWASSADKESAAGVAAIKTKEITVGDLKLSVPEAWKRRQPKSEMRLAEYEVPPVEGDKQTGEFVVSYDKGQEGDTKKSGPDGLSLGFAKGQQVTIRDGGSKRVGFYELVDITGTYNKPVGSTDQGKSERLEGWRAVKVYLNYQKVRYVLKLDGPAKTVEANLDGLRATFGGDAKKEREWR